MDDKPGPSNKYLLIFRLKWKTQTPTNRPTTQTLNPTGSLLSSVWWDTKLCSVMKVLEPTIRRISGWIWQLKTSTLLAGALQKENRSSHREPFKYLSIYRPTIINLMKSTWFLLNFSGQVHRMERFPGEAADGRPIAAQPIPQPSGGGVPIAIPSRNDRWTDRPTESIDGESGHHPGNHRAAPEAALRWRSIRRAGLLVPRRVESDPPGRMGHQRRSQDRRFIVLPGPVPG